jgi:GNAT superfamily N-acetyltransferase
MKPVIPAIDDPIFDQVVCRPALPLDTPGMLELTSHIWEGDDYVPKVWQEWLFDHQGLLAVAELQGKVVGIGKLTRLSQEDWWLEGLRVHPEYEGNRIASRIQKYLLEIWEKNGSGSIRFATISTREPVKHLAHVNDFQSVAEYSTFKSKLIGTLPKKSNPFRQIESHESTKVVDWLISQPREKLSFGLMNLGWQFAPPKESYLTDHFEENRIWWWQRDRGVLIMVEKKIGSEIWGRVQLLACDLNDLVNLLSDTHILAARSNYAGVTWLAPLIPGIEQITAKAGFNRDWESSLLVFEKSYST